MFCTIDCSPSSMPLSTRVVLPDCVKVNEQLAGLVTPGWIIGAGPRLWIMIRAGPRLGLGHRLIESVDALILALDEAQLRS